MSPTGVAFAVASLLLVAASPARCDEPPLVADRPGFGESASAVARGQLQLEAGASWLHEAEDSVLDAPELLARAGLAKGLELRVAVPDWTDVRARGGHRSGFTDLSVGLKAHWALDGHDFALRASAYLPTGSSELTSHTVDPEVALAWSHTLCGPWSLAATVSQRWQREVEQSFTSPSVSVGRNLGATAGTFVEYGAIASSGEPPIHRFDHGYTWTPRPDTQLDVSLGVALVRGDATFFVAAGLCHRL
jgi:hypothetical protein